jgi:hypothetical protein
MICLHLGCTALSIHTHWEGDYHERNTEEENNGHVVFNKIVWCWEKETFHCPPPFIQQTSRQIFKDDTNGFASILDICFMEVRNSVRHTLIKKNKFFLIYKEFRRDRLQIHKWLTASSYMVKYLRISSLGSHSSNMTLQPVPSEFPYIWGKFCYLFYQCRVCLYCQTS